MLLSVEVSFPLGKGEAVSPEREGSAEGKPSFEKLGDTENVELSLPSEGNRECVIDIEELPLSSGEGNAKVVTEGVMDTERLTLPSGEGNTEGVMDTEGLTLSSAEGDREGVAESVELAE